MMKLSKFMDNGDVVRVIAFLCFVYKKHCINTNAMNAAKMCSDTTDKTEGNKWRQRHDIHRGINGSLGFVRTQLKIHHLPLKGTM